MISQICRTALLAFMISIPSWAEGPSEPGGGSVYIQINQKPILLDYVTGGVFQDNSDSQALMTETPFLKKLHFEFFDLKRSQLYASVSSAIKNLKNYPKLQKIMKFALDDLKLIYTFNSIREIDTIFIPKVLAEQSNKIKTVIFYDTHFGGITDANLFNQMGAVSQTGLIFHEVLRKLQLVYKIQISDEEIQYMTYFEFKDLLDSHNDEVVNHALNAYQRIESTLSGDSPEIILINNMRNWICFEFNKRNIPENSHSFCNNIELLKQRSRYSIGGKLTLKTPVEIYGDMIVEIDIIRSNFSPSTEIRKNLDELRNLVELQMFPNDVFDGWMTWNNFPAQGKNINFTNLSLYLNNPTEYHKLYKTHDEIYRSRLEKDHRNASEDLGDKALQYLQKNFFTIK